MSDFKIGDEVWKIELLPDIIMIDCCKIIKIEDGCQYRQTFINSMRTWNPSREFKTKQECIDAFKNRLDEL